MNTRQRQIDFRRPNDESDEETPHEDRTRSPGIGYFTSDGKEDNEITDNRAQSSQQASNTGTLFHPTTQDSTQATSSPIQPWKKQKKQRSAPATEWMWDYYTVKEINRPYQNRAGNTVHKDREISCNHVDRQGIRCSYRTSDSQRQGNTSNMKGHLERHGIFNDSAPESASGSRPSQRTQDIRYMMTGNGNLSPQQILQKDIMRWVVCDKNAFNAVESQFFKQIWINSPYYDPPFNSRHTLRGHIMKTFEEQRMQLKEELALTCQTIALSLMSGRAPIISRFSASLAVG